MHRRTNDVIRIDAKVLRRGQFIATSTHVEALQCLLEQWGNNERVIVLVGGAGYGKSRLLSHLWHNFLDDQCDFVLALDYELDELSDTNGRLMMDAPGLMDIEFVADFVRRSSSEKVLLSMRTEQALAWADFEPIVTVQLNPLPIQDTHLILEEYAKSVDGQHFSAEAERVIHYISGGIPRKIIRLVEQSLLEAQVDAWGRVDRRHVWMAQTRLLELQRARAVCCQPASMFDPIAAASDSIRIVG